MSGEVYTVQRNDCPWNVSRKRLEASGKKATGTEIAKEMKRLAKLNGCESVDEFAKKFFLKCGSKIVCEKEQQVKPSKTPVIPAEKDNTIVAKPDTTRVEREDTTRVFNPFKNVPPTEVKKDSVSADSVKKSPNRHHRVVDSFEAEAERINSIKGDKNRIIEYNKTHAKGNYVIVDKKTCQATVYDKQGKVLKSYEVLLGATKGDDLSTAFAADQNLVRNGRRTVPGEFKLGARRSQFGGIRMLGGLDETFDPDVKKRKWAPGQWGKRKFAGGFQAIHGTANRAVRDDFYHNGNLSDNRQSLGCVNIPVEALNEMEKKFGIGTGSTLYILPETKGNELVLTKRKDGEIKFMTKYKDEAQNVKQQKIQDAIANKNILAAKKKAEQERLLAEQKRLLAEQQRRKEILSYFNPMNWFA